MFEDLRNEGNASPLFQQEEELDPILDAPLKKKGGSGFKLNFKFNRKFLGMTASQRFIVSAAILFMVSLLGFTLLMAAGKVVVF